MCIFAPRIEIYKYYNKVKTMTNYRIGVDYKLYTVQNGVDTLEEETTAGQPFRFLSGFGMCLEDFENQVAPLSVGDTFDFQLPVDKAYGPYDERGVIELDKEMFTIDGKFDTENVAEGRIIQLQNAEGQRFPGLVVAITDKVKIDLNHPLAGKELHFVGKVVEKEEASAQEIQAMIAHMTGEGGCGGCGGGSCSGCGGGSCGEGGCGEGGCCQ